MGECSLVVEDKLVAVEDRPEEILERRLRIDSASDGTVKLFQFVRRWFSAQATDGDPLRDFVRFQSALDPTADESSFLNLATCGFAIEKMQSLGEGRCGLGLASARRVAIRTTKRRKEVVGCLSIGHLNRS